jgi:hypothetical protein
MAPADETLLAQDPAPPAATDAAAPTPRKLVAPKAEMNRQERLISTAYLAMIVMIVAFLAASGLVAWLSA